MSDNTTDTRMGECCQLRCYSGERGPTEERRCGEGLSAAGLDALRAASSNWPAAQVAIGGQDGALVVPAEVTFCRPDPLTLRGTGQGVRTARTAIRTPVADTQLSLDGARIHPTPPPTAGPIYCPPAGPVFIDQSPGPLEVRERTPASVRAFPAFCHPERQRRIWPPRRTPQAYPVQAPRSRPRCFASLSMTSAAASTKCSHTRFVRLWVFFEDGRPYNDAGYE